MLEDFQITASTTFLFFITVCIIISRIISLSTFKYISILYTCVSKLHHNNNQYRNKIFETQNIIHSLPIILKIFVSRWSVICDDRLS